MAEKMDLIVAGPDFHVLAAALRHNTAGAAPVVADLVGDGLKLRDPTSGDTIVSVPAEELKPAQVDLREDVLLTAHNFTLVETLPEEGAVPHANPIQLDGATITANLPAVARKAQMSGPISKAGRSRSSTSLRSPPGRARSPNHCSCPMAIIALWSSPPGCAPHW